MAPLPFHGTMRGVGAPTSCGGTARSGLFATLTSGRSQVAVTYYANDRGAPHVLITAASAQGTGRRTLFDGPEARLLIPEA